MSAIQSESDLGSFVRLYSFLNVVSCPPAQRAHVRKPERGGGLLGRLNSGRSSQQRAAGAASVAVQAKAQQIALLRPLLQCRFCGSISTPRGGTGHPLRLGIGTTGTVTILFDCSAHASEKLLGFQAQTLPRHRWSTAASGVELQRSQQMIRSCPASGGPSLRAAVWQCWMRMIEASSSCQSSSHDAHRSAPISS